MIPEILYKQTSGKYGIGEEKKVNNYLVRELDGEGAIGFYDNVHTGFKYFCVWEFFPEFGSEKKLLQIFVGPLNQGLWVARKGHFVKEALRAEFPTLGLNLESKLIGLVASTMAFAAALLQSPVCSIETFWEIDKNPDGFFLKP